MWEELDSKIVLKLDELIGKSTLEHKLTTFGDIVYQTSLPTFGTKQHKIRVPQRKGKRQREMEMLRKQKRNLRKQMKAAPVEKQTGLQAL
ncbi:reverse transcriptase [Plakobranchus ocellatus]|uniref:Reverse transcriptase n=1 Tax=Plakobranchus ocellatus TaxID=259542 RepID=A0AAV4A6X3_9GAST|nr:reverse transcriptase [Plakobranchus ocellatus]